MVISRAFGRDVRLVVGTVSGPCACVCARCCGMVLPRDAPFMGSSIICTPEVVAVRKTDNDLANDSTRQAKRFVGRGH